MRCAMTRLTADDKALAHFRNGDVLVTAANDYGVRYTVQGSRREPYVCAVGKSRNGTSITSCTCANADIHPVRPNCAHVRCGKMLWRD